MAKVSSGVFPVHNNTFEIGTGADAFAPIAQMETFEVTVDTGIETWNPMELEGWQDALATSKAMEIKLSGKRCIGDAGNDFCAGKMFSVGQDAYVPFKWTRPNGDVLTLAKAVIAVAGAGGGSVDVAPLEITLTSACKPEVTTANA